MREFVGCSRLRFEANSIRTRSCILSINPGNILRLLTTLKIEDMGTIGALVPFCFETLLTGANSATSSSWYPMITWRIFLGRGVSLSPQ